MACEILASGPGCFRVELDNQLISDAVAGAERGCGIVLRATVPHLLFTSAEDLDFVRGIGLYCATAVVRPPASKCTHDNKLHSLHLRRVAGAVCATSRFSARQDEPLGIALVLSRSA